MRVQELAISPYHNSPEKDVVNELANPEKSRLARIALGVSKIAAIGIATLNPGEDPYYFDPERVGLNGDLFTMKKVHTMNGEQYLRGGRTLRTLTIDEWPQLEHVPEYMNFVGPRSLQAKDKNAERELMLRYDSPIHPDTMFGLRELMRPGATGITQIQPKLRHEPRNDFERYQLMLNMYQLELPYLTEGTMEDDKRIIGQTFIAAIRGHRQSFIREPAGQAKNLQAT